MQNSDYPMKEEFTKAMHSELQIDEETEMKHKVWTYLDGLSWDTRSIEQQMRSYGFTQADVDKYRPSWEALQKLEK
jgi:hypothetical protein